MVDNKFNLKFLIKILFEGDEMETANKNNFLYGQDIMNNFKLFFFLF